MPEPAHAGAFLAVVLLPRLGLVMQAPESIAPEHADGRPVVFVPASDMWCFALLVREILTGSDDHYHGSHVDGRSVRAGNDPVKRLDGFAVLPASVRAELHRCWEFEPARRPTATALLAVLASEAAEPGQGSDSASGLSLSAGLQLAVPLGSRADMRLESKCRDAAAESWEARV